MRNFLYFHDHWACVMDDNHRVEILLNNERVQVYSHRISKEEFLRFLDGYTSALSWARDTIRSRTLPQRS